MPLNQETPVPGLTEYNFDFTIPPIGKVPQGMNLDKLVRDNFRLPPRPTQDASFITSFIHANSLDLQTAPVYPMCDLKVHVGLEVEVENVLSIQPNIPLCFWKIENDGSLRNHGREFKTVALPMKYAQTALTQLFAGLNPDIDFSHRTSIHVHLDVRGMTVSQVLGLLFTYAVVENLLFKFAGASRRNNIFCTPITETRLFTDLDIRNSKALFRHLQETWQKYSALNVLPIAQFGTVEFRQMPGTKDVMKLCIWLDLLAKIRLFAYKNSLSSILATISDLNTNSQYRRFVESIFGELISYLDASNLMMDMEKAVYICKNCAAVNEFHQMVIKIKTPDSQLWTQLALPESFSTKLPPDLYEYFLILYKGNHDFQTEEEFYGTIQINLRDYARAFPNYLKLFSFIREHPIP